MIDSVLDTLFLPIREGEVALPEDGPALFLRARTGDALDGLPRAKILCDQSFRPDHDALARAGFNLHDGDDGRRFGLTLVLPHRQRDENRALLARAVTATRDGGIVMAAASNLEGARTFAGDLESLAGKVASLSKNKCRVFRARIEAGGIDRALIADWLDKAAPRDIGGGFLSRPGLFAWDRFDAGSRLLVENLPPSLSGTAADLGAGTGYLSLAALNLSPGLTRIDLYEAEARALELARRNLASFGGRAGFHWADVTRGVQPGYDVILSNPPFHVDRADRHDLGRAFIARAAEALRPGGVFLMVANRHLPYEEALKAAFRAVVVLADNGAYKVFRAIGK